MKAPTLLTTKDFGGDKSFLLKWAAMRMPHMAEHGFGPDSVPVAVVKGTGAHDARLLAVVIFNTFNAQAKSIQISCASDSPMWAHPETLRELLRYPFEQLGCFMVWTMIGCENERSIRFNRKAMGMRQHGPIPHVFGEGKHAFIMQMTRHQWARKWKEVTHGNAIERRQFNTCRA